MSEKKQFSWRSNKFSPRTTKFSEITTKLSLNIKNCQGTAIFWTNFAEKQPNYCNLVKENFVNKIKKFYQQNKFCREAKF